MGGTLLFILKKKALPPFQGHLTSCQPTKRSALTLDVHKEIGVQTLIPGGYVRGGGLHTIDSLQLLLHMIMLTITNTTQLLVFRLETFVMHLERG